MSATVHTLPFAAATPAERPSLNLAEWEVREAAAGYKRPADQLRELHQRGFVRAHRAGPSGKVVLERAHYEAVTRGQFGQPAASQPAERTKPKPDVGAFMARFGKKGKA